MNRRGMLALMDAMLFIAVIAIALSATLQMGLAERGEGDASDLLDGILSTEVRMSDFDESGDGSRVRLSDMIALHMTVGLEGVGDYLEELLQAYAGGRHCSLTLEFGDRVLTVGSGEGVPYMTAEREVPVTTGGHLRAELSLYSS